MEFQLKALTDIWTGGIDGRPDGTYLTGIKGSIRWWYEALIRGLKRHACDPVNRAKTCPPFQMTSERIEMVTAGGRIENIVKQAGVCPTCYLFGCTGWSGKFRLRIKKKEGVLRPSMDVIKANKPFALEFVPLKQFEPAEEILLAMTLKLVVEYGAIAGRTTFKPSEISKKNTKLHHTDFGVIMRGEKSNIPEDRIGHERVTPYLDGFSMPNKEDLSKKDDLPDLRYFWFVKGRHLNRLEMNQLVHRTPIGGYDPSGLTAADVIRGGFIPREKSQLPPQIKQSLPNVTSASKKIFSFHGQGTNGAAERCFGYTTADEFERLIKMIEAVPTLSGAVVEKGTDLLRSL